MRSPFAASDHWLPISILAGLAKNAFTAGRISGMFIMVLLLCTCA